MGLANSGSQESLTSKISKDSGFLVFSSKFVNVSVSWIPEVKEHNLKMLKFHESLLGFHVGPVHKRRGRRRPHIGQCGWCGTVIGCAASSFMLRTDVKPEYRQRDARKGIDVQYSQRIGYIKVLQAFWD